jgi:hypothetical protein
MKLQQSEALAGDDSTSDDPYARVLAMASPSGRGRRDRPGAVLRLTYVRHFNDGGRYDPVTDQWIATSLSGARTPRVAQGIWTGADVMVWGGDNDPTGGRYHLATDHWSATTTLHAPPALWGGRWSTVWTGTQMIIWGGFGPTQKGGFYCLSGQANPAPVAVADAFSARAGRRLVVGTDASVLLNDSDGNGDPLSAHLVNGPSHGSL